MEDQEKLRKRQREQDQSEEKGKLKSKARSTIGVKATAAGGATVPCEEEVEEFFEILRRMHEAVRYFDKKINVDGQRDGRFSGKLREALETGLIKLVTPTTSEGDHGNGKEPVDDAKAPASEKNQIFDLNNEPDQEIVELAASITGVCMTRNTEAE